VTRRNDHERTRVRNRVRRLRAIPAVVVVPVLALILAGRGAPTAPVSPAPAQPAPAAMSVSLSPGRAGAPVPRAFLGLSFELSSLGQIANYGARGNFVTLLRSLGPGVLRFGGVSADTQVAWVDAVTPRQAWATSVLDEGKLRELRSLAQRSGWRVLLTIGIAHFEPASAAREAAAAKAALGPWLAGFELGNEPDAYLHHGLRPAPWTFAAYNQQVAVYRRAISKAAPGVALAGPDVSGSAAFPRWGTGEARRERPALLTGHHYPLGCHQTPAPSVERLLDRHIGKLEEASLDRYMTVARDNGIPFRLDETNSVSCGGMPGISNTFASALWAVNYLSEAMVEGTVGVNFHGNVSNCGGYAPVCAANPEDVAAGALRAQPEWYALLLGKSLIGDRPVPSVVKPTRPNVSVTTWLARDGSLVCVVVDRNDTGSRSAAVNLHVGRGFGAAASLTLTAPSLTAGLGVTLGGRSVARDGSWQPPAALPQRPNRAGVITLTVSPASAVLVTMQPRRHG
jgi:hypothetical protein